MADDGPSLPLHDTIEMELTTDQISADLSTQVGDTQSKFEEMDVEDQEEHLRSNVNLHDLCTRTVASVNSVVASAIGKPYPNRLFLLCLHRICAMMAKFLVPYRISKRGVNRIDRDFANDAGVDSRTKIIWVT
jgi:hypothetical protein